MTKKGLVKLCRRKFWDEWEFLQKSKLGFPQNKAKMTSLMPWLVVMI